MLYKQFRLAIFAVLIMISVGAFLIAPNKVSAARICNDGTVASEALTGPALASYCGGTHKGVKEDTAGAAPTDPAAGSTPALNGPSLAPSDHAPYATKDPAACDTAPGDTSTTVVDLKKCVQQNCIVVGIINPLIKVVSILVGVIAVIMLIAAGIIYSSAQDDPQRVSLAKKIILNTIIGLISYVFLTAFIGFIVPGGLSNKDQVVQASQCE